MKLSDIIIEAAPDVKSVGVPDGLIRMVFGDANIEHNAKPIAINSKKQMMDLLKNNVIFAVGADGSAGAIRSRQSNWDKNPGATLYLVTADGSASQDYKTLSAAISGLPRGKYYAVAYGNGGYYHGRGSREVAIAQGNRSASNDKDVQYINDTFGERIRSEATAAIQHIKNIYFDVDPRWTSTLKNYVADLQKFVDRGITQDNIESWLRHNNKHASGWGSHYTNINSLFELFQEEPAARAKFAKFLIDWIRKARENADRYANY
jgi:hypothetical protein